MIRKRNRMPFKIVNSGSSKYIYLQYKDEGYASFITCKPEDLTQLKQLITELEESKKNAKQEGEYLL